MFKKWLGDRGNTNDHIDNRQTTGLNVPMTQSTNSSTHLIKNNQKFLLDRMAYQVGEAGVISDNLIDVIRRISTSTESQQAIVVQLVDEIGNYSAITEQVAASTESSKEIFSRTLSIANEGQSAVMDSKEAISQISNTVGATRDVVFQLREKASKVDAMLNAIKEIANRTNLLSLNASIEAARAGEAGKGFAVVAQEVKNLSQDSLASAKTIEMIVTEIDKSVKDTLSSMDGILSSVADGIDSADNTKKVFDAIMDAIRSSNKVAEEITTAISSQASSLEGVIQMTDEMNGSFRTLANIAEQSTIHTQIARTSLSGLKNINDQLTENSQRLIDLSGRVEESKSSIRTSIRIPIHSLDPVQRSEFVIDQVMTNLHGGLLSVDSQSNICPGIAKSWELSDDGLTWFFSLRKGARFHDGSEVTSEDVKYAYERILDPTLKSGNEWCFEEVEGSDAVISGKTKEIIGIKTLDRYRLSITLKSRQTGFLHILTNASICAIISKPAIKQGKVVGCGPYRPLTVTDQEIVFEAFKDFYGGCAYIDRIIFDVADENGIADGFNDKRYDFIFFERHDLFEKIDKTDPDTRTIKKPLMGSYFAVLNQSSTSPYITNREVRRALNLLINKERIINDLLGGMGVPSCGPLPPAMVGGNGSPVYKHDLAKAKDILRRAGLPNASVRLRVMVREDAGSLYAQVTNCLLEDFKAAGIHYEVIKVPKSDYLNRNFTKKGDLYMFGWVADSADPDAFLQPLLGEHSNMNFAFYSNPELAQSLHNARSTVDPDKKIELYRQIQSFIIDEAPWIFLFHQQSCIAHQSRLQGVDFNPMGMMRWDNLMLVRD